eukprot:scaffold185_cov233-Chaetoceros_neogracile.AAC.3
MLLQNSFVYFHAIVLLSPHLFCHGSTTTTSLRIAASAVAFAEKRPPLKEDATAVESTIISQQYAALQGEASSNNRPYFRSVADNSIIDSPYFWKQVGADIDGDAVCDRSGRSVAISADGSRVIVSTLGFAGHARVFQHDDTNGSWIQVGADIDVEGFVDLSGRSVGISADGSKVIVGAILNDGTGNNAGTNVGHARVFQQDDTNGTWIQVGADIDGESADDYAGYSVGISADGSRVIVGAPLNDGNGVFAGHFRVFIQQDDTNGSWIQVGGDIDGEAAGDRSGYSVEISADGSRVIMGAPSNNNASGANAGHARVFQQDDTNGSWIQVGGDIDGEAAGDWSGHSVGISADGSRVIVGAPYNEAIGFKSGHARVFQQQDGTTNGSWIQVGGDIDGEAAGDRSGYSVGISADGIRVIVGAYANGGNGADAGHARVFQQDDTTNGSWIQVGGNIDGEAAGDWSGWSVGISADGSRVIMGAPNNDDSNGANAGHVRIFDLLASPTASPTASASPAFKMEPSSLWGDNKIVSTASGLSSILLALSFL